MRFFLGWMFFIDRIFWTGTFLFIHLGFWRRKFCYFALHGPLTEGDSEDELLVRWCLKWVIFKLLCLYGIHLHSPLEQERKHWRVSHGRGAQHHLPMWWNTGQRRTGAVPGTMTRSSEGNRHAEITMMQHAEYILQVCTEGEWGGKKYSLWPILASLAGAL